MAFVPQPGLYSEIDDCFSEIMEYLTDWDKEMNRLKQQYYSLYSRSACLLDQLEKAGYASQAVTFGKSAQTYERLWKSCDRISSPQAIGPYMTYYSFLR